MLASAAALGTAMPASAAGFADPAEIDRAVAQFAGAPTGSQGGARLPVDRRLKLSQCLAPLALEWYGRARDTVLVQCPVSGGWRLFVPIEAGPAAAARAEKAVTRGEVVSIAVHGRGFVLSRQGEALESGAVGDWIRVRPAGAKQDTVRVRILQPGKVGMELP
ncbi:flagellar protein [Altererythrobacter soli]|uniref:Flagellar protein n=2 Tax=Croceibacterium soli TaxID=1739690 RepID=A0A6I4URZ0_9SPHN|nr:flagellar protein [Croceibacterium soli]